MNKEAQQQLDSLLVLTPEELTDAQADFIRARRSYLNGDQLKKFASILPAEEGAEKPEGKKSHSKKVEKTEANEQSAEEGAES